jgi:hypothetical protein
MGTRNHRLNSMKSCTKISIYSFKLFSQIFWSQWLKNKKREQNKNQ